MKKLFFSMLALTLLLTACKTDKKTDNQEHISSDVVSKQNILDNATHKVDATTSTVKWEAFKPTGKHNGTVPIKDGGVIYKDGALQQGEFVLQMSDLKVLDLQNDEEMHSKLTYHLNAADFFDTANHPTATYAFNAMEDGKLIGNLTVKGISKPLSIPVNVSEANGVVRIQAEPFKIDRTEFDIKYKSKKFFDNLKDKFINDEFDVSFDVMLK